MRRGAGFRTRRPLEDQRPAGITETTVVHAWSEPVPVALVAPVVPEPLMPLMPLIPPVSVQVTVTRSPFLRPLTEDALAGSTLTIRREALAAAMAPTSRSVIPEPSRSTVTTSAVNGAPVMAEVVPVAPVAAVAPVAPVVPEVPYPPPA